MRERSERSGGLGQFLFEELRSAVADIRSKLITEGWFGRRSPEVSGPDALARDWSGPTVHTLPGRQAFEEQWAPRAPGEARDGPQDQGLDLDR